MTPRVIRKQRSSHITMPRPNIWRVRVKKAIEDWVEVQASAGPEAEQQAANVLGVLSVFPRSAIRADFVPESERPVGVREEDQ